MKNILPRMVNYAKAIVDKKKLIWKVRHDAVNVEGTLEYLKIQ